MKIRQFTHIIILALGCSWLTTHAQEGDTLALDVKNAPAFINTQANVITLNGNDWEALARKLHNAGKADNTFTIVEIGDSHVQPDGSGSRIRRELQSRFGLAGRGLMSPYRVAGTNQPLDYTLTCSPVPLATSSLLRKPWTVSPGFTGIGVQPSGILSTFTIECQDQPFNRLRLYLAGQPEVFAVGDDNGQPIDFKAENHPWGTEIILQGNPHSQAQLTLKGQEYILHGIDARADADVHGVTVHSLGNNGASYATYASLPGGLGKGIQAIGPDLIIISLGTNDAFAKTSGDALCANIDAVIADLRRYNPDAQIILTTPAECQRSFYVKGKRRKGRRRIGTRRYQAHPDIERVVTVIKQYGADNNIPVYDFYSVAGGKGASAQWLSHGLLSQDRVHRTWTGYYLEGDLLTEALLKALPEPKGHHRNK